MKIQSNAINTYIAKSASIQSRINALQQLVNDHFGHDPDDIHWGHVGDLDRVQTLLDELVTMFGSDT